jgi:hypothetical protein
MVLNFFVTHKTEAEVANSFVVEQDIWLGHIDIGQSDASSLLTTNYQSNRGWKMRESPIFSKSLTSGWINIDNGGSKKSTSTLIASWIDAEEHC